MVAQGPVEYDLTTLPNRYHNARQLSLDSADLWRRTIRCSVPISEVNSIVDLGSGTGRFTKLLGEVFKVGILGVEPSKKMREQAAAVNSGPLFHYREGHASAIPCESDSVDLLFMSMVFHHIKNRVTAIDEMRRVLHEGGFLLVRNYTDEALSELPYLRFFPTARNVEVAALPSRTEVRSHFSQAGFENIVHQVVIQEAAPNARAYFNKIAQRAYSDLASITDAEFESGLRMMSEQMNLADRNPVMEPVDFFVFRK